MAIDVRSIATRPSDILLEELSPLEDCGGEIGQG